MEIMKCYELDVLPDIQKVGVYAIHNKKTDRYYIGSTTNIYHRLSLHMRALSHLCGINRKMEEDFKEPENFNDFEWIILELYDDYSITNWELRSSEWRYIEKYDAISKGYNTCIPSIGNIPSDKLVAPTDYMTEKQKQAIFLYLPHYLKDRYKAHAESKGKSLNALIVELLEEDINAK